MKTQSRKKGGPANRGKNSTAPGDPGIEKNTKEAKALHAKLQGFGPKTLPIAIELGNLLRDLKKAVGHGNWLPYLEKELEGLKPRSASDYILLAKNEKALRETAIGADFGIVEALAWIRDRKPERKSPESKEILLANGDRVPMRKLGWKEGVLAEDLVESTVTGMKPGSKRKDETDRVACRQRAFIRFAGDVNRISSDPGELSEAAAALESLQGLLANFKAEKAA